MTRCPDCDAWPEDCQCDDWIEEEERRISVDFPWVREAYLRRWEAAEDNREQDLLTWVLSERPWLQHGSNELTELIDGVCS